MVTTVIGLAMAAMIRTEFKAQDKTHAGVFEINPVAEDIKVVKRETKLDPIKKVTPPPPAPMIDRQPSVKPTESIASVTGSIPIFEPPDIDAKIVNIRMIDRDEQPILRIPPIMPSRAERSGHCQLRFDVSPNGAPYNVTALYCTQSLFERASIKSVQKWKYNPKLVGGQAVARSGVESKVSFRLNDERGRLIPE